MKGLKRRRKRSWNESNCPSSTLNQVEREKIDIDDGEEREEERKVEQQQQPYYIGWIIKSCQRAVEWIDERDKRRKR